MTTRRHDWARAKGLEKGQRLYCPNCGSEIEVLNPGDRGARDQEFHCCGAPMRLAADVTAHAGMER